ARSSQVSAPHGKFWESTDDYCVVDPSWAVGRCTARRADASGVRRGGGENGQKTLILREVSKRQRCSLCQADRLAVSGDRARRRTALSELPRQRPARARRPAASRRQRGVRNQGTSRRGRTRTAARLPVLLAGAARAGTSVHAPLPDVAAGFSRLVV